MSTKRQVTVETLKRRKVNLEKQIPRFVKQMYELGQEINRMKMALRDTKRELKERRNDTE